MTDTTRRRLLIATSSAVAAQLFHAAVPADPDAAGEGYQGVVGGAALLVALVAAAIGLARRREWAVRLAYVGGVATVAGLMLYHAMPVESPLTSPYWGADVSAMAWVSVALAVATAAWTALEARRASSHQRDVTLPA